MKSIFTICISLVTVFSAFSQVTLYTEDFETGGTSMTINTSDVGSTPNGNSINQWIINNAYTGGTGSLICLGFPFSYTINNTPGQPAGINSPNGNYLHTISDYGIADNIFCSSYAAADGICILDDYVFSRMTNDVSTIGYDSVSFNFWWACAGGTAIYGEVYYSTNSGSSWTQITVPISQYINQSTWVQQNLTDPIFGNQPTLRFGFRFVNQTSNSALDPGFSIDDLSITAQPACSNTTNTISASACGSYTSPSGNYNWTTSNTYMDTIPNAAGCDSVITLNLTITPLPNVATSVNGITIMVDNTADTYQWYDCVSGQPILGETSQSFIPSANGQYAAIVMTNGCTDTSSCTVINTIGLYEFASTNFKVSPNPFDELVTIHSGGVVMDEIAIYTMLGETILSMKEVNTSEMELDLSTLPIGTYNLVCKSSDGSVETLRIVKIK